jgi:amino acid adenylation domain-containing protein
MYKSGDLGRWRADGSLEFLGRNDFQVKVRGFRIELGEIEARLAACEGVGEAAVIAREDSAQDKRLVAYVVMDEAAFDASQLRAALATQLADYMLPAAFVRLDAFPLTPNGKLDRRALPAPDATAVAARAYEAPVGPTEEALAAIWQELLGLERVGRHDHFFELGGHSLLIIGMLERLRRRGLKTDVRTLFAHPVLSALARSLGEGRAAAFVVPPSRIAVDCERITPELLPLVELSQAEIDAVVAAVPQGTSNVQDIYPLAPLQEGMFFHHLLQAEGDAYLSRSVIAFDGRTRLDGFLVALQEVVDRHDILRTGIHWQGLSRPVQVVLRDAPLAIRELAADPADARPALEQLLAATDPRTMRLPLSSAPLLAAFAMAEPGTERWLLSLLNHHLVSDHVTLELILREIQLLLQGRGDALPAPLPYRNFIAQARSVPEAEHEAYFRRALGDVDEPTAPFGVLDVQGDGQAVQEVLHPVDAALAGRIRATARTLGVSPALLFHVGFAQVVAHATGRDDVVFGTVLSGRLQGAEGSDEVLGMFINSLPLRVTLRGGDAAAVVRSAQERLAELLAHEQAPLALAQRCSGVSPSLPLFTALLNYRHSRRTQAASPVPGDDPWAGMTLLAGEERTNYPVALSVDDFGDAFQFKSQAAGGLDAARIAAYLETAVAGLVDALDSGSSRPVMDLPVLPDAERSLLLHAFNASQAEFPRDALAHQLVEVHARLRPDAIALVMGAESLTYGQLNARANRLAHRLLAAGVQPDDRVALCAGRSLALVVGLLAVMKAGAAYVPLDPAYPADRLAYMLEDSAPRALLALPGLIASDTVPMLSLAEDFIEQPDTDPVVPGLHAEHLAYVIYTSGSTGRPKGVGNIHRGLCNLAGAQRTLFDVTPASQVLQFASASFDASVWEVVMALGNGATLHLAEREELLPGPALLRTLRERRITHATLPSSALQACDVAEAPEHAMTFILAGEALPPALAAAWSRRNRLFNAYGPTETTVCATAHLCVPGHAGPVPIGRPIANAAVYVLDAQRRPVPLGAVGELYLGGENVARGYLHRPELTAERFVDDPFRGVAGARMYKSGDLGRWRADGSLEFLGRNDFQVKIRGFRIELGEIEARLAAYEGVGEAAVIAREDTPGDKRLVAYVVMDEAAFDASALRAALATQLADYMLPAAFVRLDAFPLTPNGKLDRRALPAPDATAVAARAYEAPVGPTEEALAAIWQELLGLERVGRHDHFFELGGHSLTAVQLAARLRERFDLELPLRALFECPQLSALADRLVAEQLARFDGQAVDDIAQSLAGLSEDELRALLAKEDQA